MTKGLVTYEENGFPVELTTERDVSRAVHQGRLRPDTIVRHYHPSGPISTGRADNVEHLRAFFGIGVGAAALTPKQSDLNADGARGGQPARTVASKRRAKEPTAAPAIELLNNTSELVDKSVVDNYSHNEWTSRRGRKSHSFFWTLVVAAIILLAIFLGFRTLVKAPRNPATSNEILEPARTRQAIQFKAKPSPKSVENPLADLKSVISFDSPADCELGKPLKRITEGMWRYDETAGKIVGGSARVVPGIGLVRPRFTRTVRSEGGAEFEASLPVRGLWHGLEVSRIVDEGVEESDVGSFQIRFLETPERVREVLNKQGFELSPVGQYRELDPGAGLSGSIWVKKVPGGAMLGCS